MKKYLNRILVPLIIIAIVAVYFLIAGDDLLVLVYSGIILLVLINIIVQKYVYRGKDQRFKWLSEKLKETQETLRQKSEAEKLIVDEVLMGIIIYDENYMIKWGNKYAKGFVFQNILEGRHIETISPKILSNLQWKNDKFLMKIYEYLYEIEVDYKHRIIFLKEVTDREETKNKYDADIDVIAMLNLDNLSDASSTLDVSERSYIQGKFLEALEEWADEFNFYLIPVSTSKLVAFMNKENLQKLVANEFKILDTIAAISKENDILVTLSSGIACASLNLNKLGDIAEDAMKLALSRGGDQIVVNIEGNDMMYFGANTNTAEKRTRITTRTNTNKLEKLFVEKNRIFISPHKHPDTDAFGAAMGILKMAHAFNKEAYIIIDTNALDKTVKKIIQLIEYEYVTFLDYFITPGNALDMIDRNDLLVMVDHHSFGQCMDERLPMRTKNVAIIDHHRKLSDAVEFAVMNHIEPYASSSVELVTEMLDLASKEVMLNAFEATVMLSGIMVDTNNFMYRTGARTFEACAILRNYGADTFKVKNILREGLGEIQQRSKLLSLAELVSNRFSIVEVPETIKADRILLAKTADMLLDIDATIAAFAIGILPNGDIGISARSLEGFNVQVLMEKFDGGGHLNNAGAQIENTTRAKVKTQLLGYLSEAMQEEKPMKVILIKDLRGKGKRGEVIDVASGYGNFLLSNKTAIEATSENLTSIEADRLKKEEEARKTLEEMKTLQGMVEKLPVKVYVKIGENGKLFGKINSKQISDAFKKQHNVAIDKRKIQVTSDINSLGSHQVEIKLHKDVVAKLEVLVVEQ